MNAKARAEWQAIRDAETAARLDRKARQAAALDPALVEGAEQVYAALERECFLVSLGFGPSRHIVKVSSVTAEAKPRVEKIANRAIRKTSRYPDVLAFQSYITVTIREGRQAWELEREIDRKGEGGYLHVMGEDGRYVTYGEGAGKPITTLSYDGDAA